jgi:hypothetical protein
LVLVLVSIFARRVTRHFEGLIPDSVKEQRKKQRNL